MIHASRTTYYNSLVTNRVMDYEFHAGLTIRKIFECGPMIKSLKQSALSNYFDFNGFIESADSEIMLVFRKKYVSIRNRLYGNSVEASLKFQYALNEKNIFTRKRLEKGIVWEIEDELGIHENELQLKEQKKLGAVQLLAAYRDIVEGGKPQLLFYAKAFIEKKAVEERFYDKIEKVKGKSKYNTETNKKVMKTDGNKLYWILR